MRTHIRITMIAIGFAQMASALPPTEVFVTTNGTGVGYPTWAEATNSIQGAIAIIDSSSGSTVWVDDGIYANGGVIGFPTGTIITNRVAITKPITVRSKNGPAHTIIQGAWDPAATDEFTAFGAGPASVRGVYMANGSSLIGFTVTNCAAGTDHNSQNAFGAGIYGASANTIVSNCVIVGNSAFGGGGGAYKGTLYDSVLDGNRAGFTYWGRGGGGAMGSTLYGCTLTNNFSVNGMGAFNSTLSDCVVAGHTLGSGGGVSSVLTHDFVCGSSRVVFSHECYPLQKGAGPPCKK